MSQARRRSCVNEARASGVVILEDDYVGGLRYEGQALPSLWNLAGGEGVIHTGTFSKLLAPGLGIGFAAARGQLLELIARESRLMGLAPSRILQAAFGRFLDPGAYRKHLKRATRIYGRRRDELCAALRELLPGAEFERPSGGLFLWLRLPRAFRKEELEEALSGEGIMLAPGRDFYADPAEEADRRVRINFARLPEGRAEEAVRRIVRAMDPPGR
jgi:DNA-binding transcriptional MocR family regulator